ncbi:MAG: glycosyltransferase [Saprospirales bacterium]|nr:glycosyltransferase [Saprospirales bacterium]
MEGARLSVVIVNYNVKHFLEQALLSVRRASSRLPVEVFVVDNNSVDDSVAMVRNKFPEVKLIANRHNAGFSAANNQAIRLAQGEYVLLLNPDTVVEEDTFEKCLRFMDEHPEAGSLGVKMIDGAGVFLPESKRGFPAPLVAFFKAFGFSRLFPRSRVFNHYHLGYLDRDQTHEVEVLSGAFMWLRKSVLDQVGLLDETFFMYGEDIDLSYRIVQGGYKNYYFAETTIIHYKGESTKKGSLNYVRTFYQAMIIFAQKHFSGEKMRLFVTMIRMAIYFRALLALANAWSKKIALPLLDAGLMVGGLYFVKNFWATQYYKDPNYFEPALYYFNIPLYTAVWLCALFFSGAYDPPFRLRRLVGGLMWGTLFLAAIYGFLPLDYRPSRAVILLGAIWAVLSTVSLRYILHFIRYRNFDLGREREKNLVIVGQKEESQRVRYLLHQVQVRRNIIGVVAPMETEDWETYLSPITRLEEVVYIYKVDEIIFCSRDISSQEIMAWMTRLGPQLEYKIVPDESMSIIGSSSKNSPGELYTVDIHFHIATPMASRNKRVLDFLMGMVLLLTYPMICWPVERKGNFLLNCIRVLAGKRSWVGYASGGGTAQTLPSLRKGVLSPASGLRYPIQDEPTQQRLDFFYAKDYRPFDDLDIIWRGFRFLGNK